MRITLCVVLCFLFAGCLEATKGKEIKKGPQTTEFKSNTLIIGSLNSSYSALPYCDLRLSGVIRNNSQFTLKGVRLMTEIYRKEGELLVISKDDCTPNILEPNTSGTFDISINFFSFDKKIFNAKVTPLCELGKGELFISEIGPFRIDLPDIVP